MNITVVSASVRPARLSHRVALALLSAIEKRGHMAHCIDLKEKKFPLFDGRWEELVDKPLSLL